MYQGPPAPPIFGEQHQAFRAVIRRYVANEVPPHVDAWEEAGEFPRSVYRSASQLGLLGLGFPEQYGGVAGDLTHELAMIEELSRAASGGLLASMFSHTIGAPPIVAGAPAP